ncbi:hypothetical protein ACJJTC_017335 [Scirpophaga incertulas]
MVRALSKYQKIGIVLAATAGIVKKRKKRKCWIKQYLLLRDKLCNMNILSVLEPEDFRNYLRMDSAQFDHLLHLVTPYIQKQDTLFRDSVSAEQRLVVTLRFLATGNAYHDLKYSSLISEPLLSQIIPETCWAIYRCLNNYIKMPETETEWEETAADFERLWNFSHCIGACDGKHVAIERPPESGSLFYNYKGFFSVVLFAVVNANYEFLYVQTGTNGSLHDGAILNSTNFYKKMVTNALSLPQPSPLPGTDTIVPYVFLGDSAFSLNRHFMKPFPMKNISKEKRIFNYRLSRARRVVENAFGILASRFRVLRRTLNQKLENVDAIILACCALHNYLKKFAPKYITHKFVDRENTTKATFRKGDWRTITDGLTPLQHLSDNQRNTEGNEVRDKFMKYFNAEGRVSFQDKMVNVVSI